MNINAGSSNGRTAPFEGVNAGSTPAPATKPKGIPQDIWETAQAVERECISETWNGPAAGTRAITEAIIARAILAERDRCAGLAYGAYERKSPICLNIVRRIRSGEGIV